MYEQLLPAWKEFVRIKVNTGESQDWVRFAPSVEQALDLCDGTYSYEMTSWGRYIADLCGKDTPVRFDGKDCIVAGTMFFPFQIPLD